MTANVIGRKNANSYRQPTAESRKKIKQDLRNKYARNTVFSERKAEWKIKFEKASIYDSYGTLNNMRSHKNSI